MKTHDAGGLKAYLKDVGRHPLLSTEETAALFFRLNDEKTSPSEKKRIKTQLVNSNLRLVVSIAKRYKDKGVPILDIIQEGNVGLMTGIDRFDPTLGYRLSTYASHWIKQAIRRHLTDTARTVRLPSHIVALLPRLRARRRELLDIDGVDPSATRLAEDLEVTVESVQAALDASGPVYSVDVMAEDAVRSGWRGGSRAKLEYYMQEASGESLGQDLEELAAHQQLREIVRGAFVDLTPREEQVLRLRFGCMEDPNSTAAEYQITTDELKELERRSK